MTEIKIEANIPLPAGFEPGARHRKYPYSTMAVGESFLYPLHANGITYTQANAAGAARRHLGKTFVTRIVVENGERVVRVWRTA